MHADALKIVSWNLRWLGKAEWREGSEEYTETGDGKSDLPAGDEDGRPSKRAPG